MWFDTVELRVLTSIPRWACQKQFIRQTFIWTWLKHQTTLEGWYSVNFISYLHGISSRTLLWKWSNASRECSKHRGLRLCSKLIEKASRSTKVLIRFSVADWKIGISLKPWFCLFNRRIEINFEPGVKWKRTW